MNYIGTWFLFDSNSLNISVETFWLFHSLFQMMEHSLCWVNGRSQVLYYCKYFGRGSIDEWLKLQNVQSSLQGNRSRRITEEKRDFKSTINYYPLSLHFISDYTMQYSNIRAHPLAKNTSQATQNSSSTKMEISAYDFASDSGPSNEQRHDRIYEFWCCIPSPLCIRFPQISDVIILLGDKRFERYLGCENKFSTKPDEIAHIFFCVYSANDTLEIDCSKQFPWSTPESDAPPRTRSGHYSECDRWYLIYWLSCFHVIYI